MNFRVDYKKVIVSLGVVFVILFFVSEIAHPNNPFNSLNGLRPEAKVRILAAIAFCITCIPLIAYTLFLDVISKFISIARAIKNRNLFIDEFEIDYSRLSISFSKVFIILFIVYLIPHLSNPFNSIKELPRGQSILMLVGITLCLTYIPVLIYKLLNDVRKFVRN